MPALNQMRFVTPDGSSVQLASDVLRDLARLVTEAVNALPRRGLEVGGLLLGKRTTNRIEVTSLAALPCRYPEGPSFRTSEQELQAALQQAETSGQVVGIYRSRTDDSLDLDNQDSLLLRLLGRGPIPVLLIRQKKHVDGEGVLLLWDGRGIDDRVTRIGETFPTKPWLTGALPPRKLAAATRPVAMDQEFMTDLDPVPAAQPFLEEPRNSSPAWKWKAVVAAAVLLSLFFAWRMQESRAFVVNRRSTESRRQAPVVAGEPPKPRSAAEELALLGNDDSSTLPLLKKWIRSDQSKWVREAAVRELARRWKTDPDTLTLLKERARSDESESVRTAALQELARGWQKDPDTLPFLEDLARSDKSVDVRQAATQELARDKSAAVPTEQAEAENESGEAKAEPMQSRTVKPFQPPPPRLQPPPAFAPEPPDPGKIADSRFDLPASPLPAPVLPSAPAAAPSAIVVTQPVLSKEPRPIVLPPDLRRLLRNEVVISLRIAVDSKGRVSGVYPVDQAGNAERALWTFYADAVRNWAFEPARRNNVPVAGDTILRFRVTPNIVR